MHGSQLDTAAITMYVASAARSHQYLRTCRENKVIAPHVVGAPLLPAVRVPPCTHAAYIVGALQQHMSVPSTYHAWHMAHGSRHGT